MNNFERIESLMPRGLLPVDGNHWYTVKKVVIEPIAAVLDEKDLSISGLQSNVGRNMEEITALESLMWDKLNEKDETIAALEARVTEMEEELKHGPKWQREYGEEVVNSALDTEDSDDPKMFG